MTTLFFCICAALWAIKGLHCWLAYSTVSTVQETTQFIGIFGCFILCLLNLIFVVLIAKAKEKRLLTCFCPHCNSVNGITTTTEADVAHFCPNCGEVMETTGISWLWFSRLDQDKKQSMIKAFQRGKYFK